MNKYAPLHRYLPRAQSGSELRMSFAEIERILGEPLPASAHNHRAWWSNQRTGPRPHAEAWMAAGWQVSAVNLGAQRVTFRRR